MRHHSILIVGTINEYCLESSYASAAAELNFDVTRFDPSREIQKHIRFGKLGRLVNGLVNIEIWTRKMNRELIIKAKETRPDIIMIVGGSSVLYGTLATIKAILPNCKLAWVWPDTPLNLNTNNLNYGPILDLSAAYSESTRDVLSRLGFRNVHWVPLAGDLKLHFREVTLNKEFACDLSFVGMWRPERQRILKAIIEKFGHLRIEIHGGYWKRNCMDRGVLAKWKGNGLFGEDLSAHFNRSMININVIDDTNYPAANMRFFEIPASGGLELCSSCPEMEVEFTHKREVVYFENELDAINNVEWIINNPDEAHKIRSEAQSKIVSTHNYTTRLSRIVKLLEDSVPLTA